MNTASAKQVFPAYFSNFTLPAPAKEQAIEVYRACPTRSIERASFLNTYEENNFCLTAGASPDDPQQYCLSSFIRLRDIKRFVAIDSRFQPPLLLAKGVTDPVCGPSCRTSEWKTTKRKSSHVDWWLYEGAEPWRAFKEANYSDEYENFPERR